MRIFNLGRLLIACMMLAVLPGLEAFAAGTTANVSWTAPTTYTDGSALPATDIAKYTLTWTGNTSGSKDVTTGTSTTVTVPCDGTSFTVTVTTKATAKYPSVTSSPSGPVSYSSGVVCAPNPPTGLIAN